LWALKSPKAGEKDHLAWTSARAAARSGMTNWVRLVWVRNSYLVREAHAGYAPDPDWSKIPSFDKLIELAFGAHGIIRDTDHPVYRDLIGAAKKAESDDGDL
jgi:hypothetical protein